MSYTTRKTLLEKIQRGNEVSWALFYDTYKPLILLRGRDLHVANADLEDLVQLVMLRFFNVSKKFCYDATKGRFRDYLRTMVSHCAYDLWAKRQQQQTTFLDYELAVAAADDGRWEAEWKAHLFATAINMLRDEVGERTFQAFDLYVLQEAPVDQVAEFLSMTPQAIYSVKNRVTQKLRQIIAQMEEC